MCQRRQGVKTTGARAEIIRSFYTRILPRPQMPLSRLSRAFINKPMIYLLIHLLGFPILHSRFPSDLALPGCRIRQRRTDCGRLERGAWKEFLYVEGDGRRK